jgi:hypothetical protein
MNLKYGKIPKRKSFSWVSTVNDNAAKNTPVLWLLSTLIFMTQLLNLCKSTVLLKINFYTVN